jgi:hypothetical protein
MTNEERDATIKQIERVQNHLASIGETVDYLDFAIQALESSIPIPQNATNGDVIKAVFPKVNKYNNILLEDGRKNILFGDDWWNAPYREGDASE